MQLPPSGSGRPVCLCHQSPRSTTRCRPSCSIGELALVDDQPRVGLAVLHVLRDLVELTTSYSNASPAFAQAKLQGEERGGQLAGDGDRLAAEVAPASCGSRVTTIGPYLSPMLRAAARQGVLVGDVGVGVDGDGGDLQLALHRPLVERLDVLQDVLEAVAARWAARSWPGRRT